MFNVDDAGVNIAHRALDGLAQRANVRADNLANLNTPGYRALHVEFESSLRDAVARGDVNSRLEVTTQPSPTMPDAQGNTVNLETELIGSMQDQLLREAMTVTANSKLASIRSAVGGR